MTLCGWPGKERILLLLQGRRVAQAQAQQQAEITFTESLEVVSPIEYTVFCCCLLGPAVSLDSFYRFLQVRCLLRVVSQCLSAMMQPVGGCRHFLCKLCLQCDEHPCSQKMNLHSSWKHVACLLQSIFHVSHLRGLFPSHLFKTVDMPNLGGGQAYLIKRISVRACH